MHADTSSTVTEVLSQCLRSEGYGFNTWLFGKLDAVVSFQLVPGQRLTKALHHFFDGSPDGSEI